MRVLVAIASYGHSNDLHLRQVVSQYRSMPWRVDIVVCSNVAKQIADNVEVRVGLPTADPWSLPFAHKRVLAERVNDYDLFIYSEDDILITERHIEAFLRVSAILPENELAGFIRSEKGPDSETYYCDFHGCYRWDPSSVESVNDHIFACYTNEHAACYILNRAQLKRAIASGGFLVEPHQRTYDLACTAATDPYTQCGFKKVVCVSHLDDFTVRHLSDRYVGTLSLSKQDFDRQLRALLQTQDNRGRCTGLFNVTTKLQGLKYSKSYYESAREDLSPLIPPNVHQVLSVGCGWGATEEWLLGRGFRVAGIPLDPVIAACSAARGVEIIEGDLRTVRDKLAGRTFDCLLLSNVLHLVDNPRELLSLFVTLLPRESVVIAIVPNHAQLRVRWRRFCGDERLKDLGTYEKSGVHLTSREAIRTWFSSCGLRTEKVVNVLDGRAERLHRATLGLIDSWLASEIVAVGRRV